MLGGAQGMAASKSKALKQLLFEVVLTKFYIITVNLAR
jgi:hypothetical protein